MVPLEAMSYGLPIIASKIDAFKEVENIANPHMIFFDLDSLQLTKILNHINNFDLKINGINSLNFYKSKYTDNLMNQSTLEIYKATFT